MKTIAKATLWLPIISILFTACAGPNVQQENTLNTSFTPIGLQHISGTLVQPDGKTPLAGATVYIEKRQISEGKIIAENTLSSVIKRNLGCAKPNLPYINFACTDSNGRFSLWINDIQSVPITVTFQHQHESIKSQVALNELGEDIGQIQFADTNDEVKSKIAIVIDLIGLYEQMGNTDQTFTIDPLVETEFEEQFALMYDLEEDNYDMEFISLADLFKDKDNNEQIDIYDYTMVYLISDGDEELSGLSKQSKRILLEYISNGGELFVTTLTVELDEPSIDQFI